MADAPLHPLPFEEATAWAKARKVVLPDTFYGQLQGFARAQAFSIAGIAQYDQLESVNQALIGALEKGDSFGEWKAKVKSGEVPLPGLPPHRVETIFRTNLQGAYDRGRCEQQRRHTDTHPWLLYDAVNDSRTRPSHAAMDGYVARHDDPIWATWRPPCGYNCRCRLISLTEKQVEQYKKADHRRLQITPGLAEARMHALTGGPDMGWDYDICQEPDRGNQDQTDDRLARITKAGFPVAATIAAVAAAVTVGGVAAYYMRKRAAMMEQVFHPVTFVDRITQAEYESIRAFAQGDRRVMEALLKAREVPQAAYDDFMRMDVVLRMAPKLEDEVLGYTRFWGLPRDLRPGHELTLASYAALSLERSLMLREAGGTLVAVRVPPGTRALSLFQGGLGRRALGDPADFELLLPRGGRLVMVSEQEYRGLTMQFGEFTTQIPQPLMVRGPVEIVPLRTLRSLKIIAEDDLSFELEDIIGGGEYGVVFATKENTLIKRISETLSGRKIEAEIRNQLIAGDLGIAPKVLRGVKNDEGAWIGFEMEALPDFDVLVDVLHSAEIGQGYGGGLDLETVYQSVRAQVRKLNAHGIFHLDLHPGNILINDAGEVRLIDFGLSRKAPLGSRDAVNAFSAEDLALEDLRQELQGLIPAAKPKPTGPFTKSVADIPPLLDKIAAGAQGEIFVVDGGILKIIGQFDIEEGLAKEVAAMRAANEIGIGPKLLGVYQREDGIISAFKMSRVEGRPWEKVLNAWYKDGADIPPRTLVASLRTQVESLHGKGIAHADLHANNVLLGGDQLTIIDFGLSRTSLEKTSPYFQVDWEKVAIIESDVPRLIGVRANELTYTLNQLKESLVELARGESITSTGLSRSALLDVVEDDLIIAGGRIRTLRRLSAGVTKEAGWAAEQNVIQQSIVKGEAAIAEAKAAIEEAKAARAAPKIPIHIDAFGDIPDFAKGFAEAPEVRRLGELMGPQARVTIANAGRDTAMLEVSGPHGKMLRNIYGGGPEGLIVEHIEFVLEKEFQGKGLAKQVMAAQLDLYEKLGAKRIELHAGMDVGGYAWAKYGALPELDYWEELRVTLAYRVPNLPGIKAAEKNALLKVLSSSNVEGIRLIADSPWGKQILMGTDWDGYFDLTDPDTMARLNAYIGRKPK